MCFETFGCRLNKAEALQMEANYLADGWEVTAKHSEANLFVIRGCSVTARAQYECEKLIAHLKRRYPAAGIKICGCLKNGEAYPPSKASCNAGAMRGASSPLNRKNLPSTRSGEDAASPLPLRTARAYLKVQDGCAGKCTFCIVPKFRGESRSEPFTDLLDRAKRFIDAGYHEIVVTGCNLALYASEGKRLPDLVTALAGLDTGCRIRLGSLEPGACAQETVRAMAEAPNVCRFLHLPVQSGSNKILLAMQRPYVVKDVEETAVLAAKLMPDLGLGCDLMTGFPGESELDFAATKGLLKRLPFVHAHVFPFSERPGTLAAGFPRPLAKNIRSARARLLADDMRSKRRKFAKTFIGKTVEIVVEDEKTGRGWTGEYLPCEPLSGSFVRKSVARVFITKTRDDLLLGNLR